MRVFVTHATAVITKLIEKIVLSIITKASMKGSGITATNVTNILRISKACRSTKGFIILETIHEMSHQP